MPLFEELINEIKVEYSINANTLGWRFLQSSKRTLEKNNGILLITLNPGGSKLRDDQPTDSCEDGSAYLTESWKPGRLPGTSKLQCQIQLLFKEIADKIKIKNYVEVLESSICGNFIPFRSPTFDSLLEKDKCISFSKNLWKKVLFNLELQLIFCVDKNTYKSISEVLLNLSYSKKVENAFPIAWGDYKSLISCFERDSKSLKLVWLPHLSIYSIFGREKSKEAVRVIMNEALRDYKYSSD